MLKSDRVKPSHNWQASVAISSIVLNERGDFMSAVWYFADRHNRQNGPLDQPALQAAADRGELRPESLVWREGFNEWVAVGSISTELPLRFPAAPPPLPRAAGKNAGPRVIVAERDSSSRLILLVILLVVGIGFLGILAAIAIPAYQDYTVRARVSQEIARATPIKLIVQDVYTSEQRCPINGEDGIGEERSYRSEFVDKIVVGTLNDDAEVCAMEIAFSSKAGLNADGPAKLLMYLDENRAWQYEANFNKRYLPVSMR